MTGKQLEYAINLSKRIKEKTNAKVIWGGIHATLLPNETIKNDYIDIIIRGEAEQAILEIVQALERNTSLEFVSNIYYKEINKEEKIKYKSNPRKGYINMEEILPIPWKLVDVEKYVFKYKEKRKKIRELDIGETSRGCPKSCYFCYNLTINKSTWRAMNPKQVIERVKKVIYKYKINKIMFRDDDFFANIKRVEQICKELKKLKIKWYASGIRIETFNKMTDAQIKLIKESGCESFRFGIESGSNRILRKINKKLSLKEAIKANKKCKKLEITPHYSFMIGFPDETEKDLIATVKLIDKLKKDNPKAIIHGVNIFTPYPGTVLYKLCQKEGMKTPSNTKEWIKFHHLELVTPNLNSRIRKIVKTINNLSYITSDITFNKLPTKLKIMIFPLYIWAKIRWKQRWFSFAPEIVLFEKVRKIIYGI